ncbi:ABC transporter permease [Ureibacillus sp. NPDC094379]
MANYIIKRLVSVIPVLFIVSIVVFLIIHLTPGDPASVMLGDQASEEDLEVVREQLGLNQPIYIQYFSWITNVFRGDFGFSYFMNEPVLYSIYEHLQPTLSLSILAEIFAVILAIPFGIIAAKRKGSIVDQSLMGFSLFGISVPSFLLGLILILVFGVKFPLLPVAGFVPISDGLVEHIRYLILPAIALGTMQAALIARMTRASMIEIYELNFVKAIRAKGVKEVVLTLKHVFRNALIPIITVIGQTLGTLIAGAAVIETVFNIPGIGQLILNSVERRDYAVIQGSILFITCVYIFINLVIDLLYGLIDPRVRLK